MKQLFGILLWALILQSCAEEPELSSIDSVNWEKRTANILPSDSLQQGTSYLSVYSEIYSQTEHITHNLTATVSMRNTNRHDTIFINNAEYFNTHGHSIRRYFKKPIFVAPMETVEIIIDQQDEEGGSGANFIFDWSMKRNSNEPFFECVMISTSGQQGLSFTTQGIRVTN